MVYKKFGKVEDRNLVFCKQPFLIDGVKTWSTDPEILKQAGYYPVCYTEEPVREGFYYTDYWVQENEQCVQHWEEHEVTE